MQIVSGCQDNLDVIDIPHRARSLLLDHVHGLWAVGVPKSPEPFGLRRSAYVPAMHDHGCRFAALPDLQLALDWPALLCPVSASRDIELVVLRVLANQAPASRGLGPTEPCSRRWFDACPRRCASIAWSPRPRCCAGTAGRHTSVESDRSPGHQLVRQPRQSSPEGGKGFTSQASRRPTGR
jgi:hypothetical protein